jgi:hypothetical protein
MAQAAGVAANAAGQAASGDTIAASSRAGLHSLHCFQQARPKLVSYPASKAPIIWNNVPIRMSAMPMAPKTK